MTSPFLSSCRTSIRKSLELSMCTCRTSRRIALKRSRGRMELLLRVQIGGIIEPFVDETVLARIALSCHLLWIYSVTRRGPTMRLTLYLAPLPVVGVFFGMALPPLLCVLPCSSKRRAPLPLLTPPPCSTSPVAWMVGFAYASRVGVACSFTGAGVTSEGTGPH